MNDINYEIREMKVYEKDILEDMLYEAIFQPDEGKLLPRKIIKQPEIYTYINNFGRKHDKCFVAELNGKIIGAVWVRILAGHAKGYGNIDDKTPEFAISLYKEYRNMGIGTNLMNKMIKYLIEKGYKKASLSVAKNNYAVRLYKKLGFRVIKEEDEDYIMVLDL